MRVGAGEAIEDEQFAVFEIIQHLFVQMLKDGGRHGSIDVAPVDVFLAGRLGHEVAILRRAAGVGAGVGDQGTVVGELTFRGCRAISTSTAGARL